MANVGSDTGEAELERRPERVSGKRVVGQSEGELIDHTFRFSGLALCLLFEGQW
jgi:hypothetical protein